MKNLMKFSTYRFISSKPKSVDYIISNHRLASKLKNKNITAKDINNLLRRYGIKITDSLLQEILSRPRIKFSNLDKYTNKSKEFINNIGSYGGNIQVPGIYIWTHIVTGDKYVGSSSKLANRLHGYFRGTHRSTGKFIPLLKLEGINKFELEVLPITTNYYNNLELSLEQYFLLQPEFNLNTLYVVNDYSGARAKSLYMYNKDKSKLIYSSDIREDFIFKLGIHHSTFTRCLLKEELYLDKYIFSDIPIIGAKESNLSLEEVYNILSIDRIKVQKSKGRKISLTSVTNEKDVKIFDTIKACIEFLNTIAPSNKTSLSRHIELDKPYNGYICKWESNKGLALTDKSKKVVITHIPTNTINEYSSFRKAALAFSDNFKTQGQTLSYLAFKGKLFRNEYKIDLVDKNNITSNIVYYNLKENYLKIIGLLIVLVIYCLFYYSISKLEVVSFYPKELEDEILDYYDEIDICNYISSVTEKRLLDDDGSPSDYFPDYSYYDAKINKQEEIIRNSIDHNIRSVFTNSANTGEIQGLPHQVQEYHPVVPLPSYIIEAIQNIEVPTRDDSDETF